ncbi:MAG: protein translocase subunit SecF [Clostridiaceae bacterium]|nr:protein translocase subunit SecF [Clostridiaceae bacterium]
MIDFMKYKKYFFLLPLVIILAGIIGLVVNGLNYDIQFQGGTIIQIEMSDSNFDANEIGIKLGDMLNKKVSPQKIQAYNPEEGAESINILMLKIPGNEALEDEEINSIIETLKKDYNAKRIYQMQSVQPFIANEIKQKGIKAVLVASILIILYVWWRFSAISGLPAALTAMVALLHDVIVMFCAYTIFQIPLNESFIAAVLTILGYSLNNTIIVYDRIRENSRKMHKMSVDELVSFSVKQSFNRAINTLITTLLAIVTVYVFASINNIQSIKEFAFPLIIGLVGGTYSSLFIAPTLWMMWKQRELKGRIVAKQAKTKAKPKTR